MGDAPVYDLGLDPALLAEGAARVVMIDGGMSDPDVASIELLEVAAPAAR